MAQASATSAVVMGDKSKAEDYVWANAGHTLDLGEPRQGKGGSDRVIELKAYNDLVPIGSSAPGACSQRGSTHSFGNTEERLIWANRGVRARMGAQKWSNATGGGHVDAKQGEYHDAIFVKRHEFWLVVMNLFGGINVEARKLFKLYTDRARRLDRTEYVAGDFSARTFAPHWAQLLSAALVIGDAHRALHAVEQAHARRATSDLLASVDPSRVA